MPTFYNFRENGLDYSFDDIFVPADLFRDGNLFTWGSGNYGRLGNEVTTGSISTPVTTFAGGTNWKQVSDGHPLAAIKTDGTLWTWGSGSNGRLGNGVITGDISTPVTTFAGGTNWKQVSSMSLDSTVAIKTDGTLWTWGRNDRSQLGNAGITDTSTPVTTFAGGTNWKQVNTGGTHIAAIKTDGTLWTWGFGNNGQLGDNTTGTKSTPVTTFAGGTNWKQVSGGYSHTAAIKTDGTLWTWGNGGDGRLGDNTATTKSIPVTTFAGGTNWKQVSSGDAHTAAIKTDGTLWTWGNGGDGQLGDNTDTNRSTPVTTFAGGTNWKQVSAGESFTAAIKTDGTLWTWGAVVPWFFKQGNSGVLGNASISGGAATPVTTFAGGTNWKQVTSAIKNNNIAAITYIDSVL